MLLLRPRVNVAVVVAVVDRVDRYCCRIDYWRSKMIAGVVVVAVDLAVVVVAVVAVAVLLRGWMMTVGTFSKDETLFQLRRRPAGVETL